MSIRVKLILSYFAIILICLLMLVHMFVIRTRDFFQEVADSTIGDIPVQKAVAEVLDIVVDLKYIARHEPNRFKDRDFMAEIEATSIPYGIYIFTVSHGEIVYHSSSPELRVLDDKLFDLDYEEDTDITSFNMAEYKTEKAKLHVLRYDEELYPDFDTQLYLVFKYDDFDNLGQQIYGGMFKTIFQVSIVILLLMTLVVTKMIIKPLKKLEDATVRIKNGQLDFKLPRSKKDEIGRVMASFDIMREELKNSIDKQIQYEENRRELISSISHDLKTPITSIKGYVEGIKDGVANDPEKIAKYLDVIYKKSVSLDQLIDDLFLLSKLDLNRVPFNFEKLKPNQYFNDCADEIEMDLKKLGFTLNYQSQIDSTCHIMADPQQLKRVILNVVYNAVKYSENSQRIEMKTSLNEEKIRVTIKDYGKGISKDDLDSIFEKFYRCDKSRNTKVSGSGLGLAIAKQIIEQHDGKIWAESDYGVSTTIYIEIPCVFDQDASDQ